MSLPNPGRFIMEMCGAANVLLAVVRGLKRVPEILAAFEAGYESRGDALEFACSPSELDDPLVAIGCSQVFGGHGYG